MLEVYTNESSLTALILENLPPSAIPLRLSAMRWNWRPILAESEDRRETQSYRRETQRGAEAGCIGLFGEF
jgi:hypothetical protein